MLLTLLPLSALQQIVRLACLNHAASVRSEPGSNSPIICLIRSWVLKYNLSDCVSALNRNLPRKFLFIVSAISISKNRSKTIFALMIYVAFSSINHALIRHKKSIADDAFFTSTLFLNLPVNQKLFAI